MSSVGRMSSAATKPSAAAKQIGVRQHHSLGVAGGSRGVGEQRHVGGQAPVDLAVEIARLRRAELAARSLHPLEGFERRRRVMPHAARVVVDNEVEVRQPGAQRQDLVDLLLVLGDDDPDLGMVQHVGHLGGDRVLVHRHRDAAKALCGELRPVEPRAVVADHRELVAAAKAVSGEAERELAHLALVLGPGETLPDAAGLFADRRPPGHRRTVAAQQPRQRGRRGGNRGAGHSAASARWAPPK